MVVVAKAAQAADLLFLKGDLRAGVVLANAAEFHDRGGLAVDAGLGHFDFDGKAMGIPTEDKRRLLPRHVLITDDEVLEAAVKRVAAVHRPIRIRWAIMEGERRRVDAVLVHEFVEVLILPLLHEDRFLHGKACPHGEVVAWHVECFF